MDDAAASVLRLLRWLAGGSAPDLHAQAIIEQKEEILTQKLAADGAQIELAAYEKGLGPFTDQLFVFRVSTQKKPMAAR